MKSETKTEALPKASVRDHIAPAGVIASHSFEHAYLQGFNVILPVIYTALGLNPVSAGLIGTVRQITGGVSTVAGGVVVDQLQHRRTLILLISLAMTGVGYLFLGLSPNYLLILLALSLAGSGHSIWHPAALSLLSQRYPGRRGFIVAIHRSAGNVGDTIGPLLFGGLLVYLAWQGILLAAFPIALLLALALWTLIRQSATIQQLSSRTKERRPLREQFASLKDVLRNRGLILLLLVSGVSGASQGGLMLWLPLYLQETQSMGTLGIGFHVALLSAVGIATGPVLGILSDRIGRKAVIVMMLAGKVTLATLMALVGSGVMLTILVGFMGAFLFGLNAVVQAGALDFAEGRKLEGTMIGLMWGNNALFSGGAPLLMGFLIASLGFGILFWYIAAGNLLALLLAASMPSLRRGGRTASQG